MNLPKIMSHDEWLVARKRLLAKGEVPDPNQHQPKSEERRWQSWSRLPRSCPALAAHR